MAHNPSMVILHGGSNNLRLNSTPEKIAAEIISLAHELKNEYNDVMISGITSRKDKYNDKAKLVNTKLKTLCDENLFEFIDNSNINAKQHLSYDGLHLNINGVIALGKNFCNAISY